VGTIWVVEDARGDNVCALIDVPGQTGDVLRHFASRREAEAAAEEGRQFARELVQPVFVEPIRVVKYTRRGHADG